MIAVHLHGDLAKFGGPFPFDIATPAEAIRALDCAFPKDFARAMRSGSWRLLRGDPERGEEIAENALDLRLGRATDLHIIPVLKGAGGRGGGIGKAILGTALMAVSIIAAPAGAGIFGSQMGASAFSVFGQSISYGNLAMMGAAMAFNGLSQAISPQVATSSQSASADQRASHIFNGAVNTLTEGGPIPLGWGTCRSGGVLISRAVTIEAI